MKSVLSVACLAVAVLWVGPGLSAQDAPKQDAPPQEQEPKGPVTPEEAAREQIEKNYRAVLAGQDVKVTMEFRNARVQDVIEEFRRQVRVINFIVDLRNVPEEYRVDEFIVRNEPWRSALNAFVQKAELAIEEESPTLIRIIRPTPITVHFKDADIKTVVDVIARMSGANIIMDTGKGGVGGTISMTMNNVPWFEVLQAAVRTLGYVTVREKHDIIRIVRPEELYKQMDRQVFRLKYLSAPTVYKAQMEEGKYLKGKPVPSPASITDLEKHFTLLEFLRGVLTRDSGGRVLGTLRYDFQTNAIMVTDTKNVLDEIGRILKVLDVEPPQVRIDLKYVSTINEDLLAFGMNYSLGAEEGLTITTQPVPPTRVDAPAATPGAAFNSPFTSGGIGKFTRLPFGLGREPFLSDQYFLTRFDMLAAFRAFKRDRYSKLVQRPTLHVVDNVESTIFVGEEVPYAATQASLTQTGGVVFNIGEGQRSPVKIGFQILVVPKIIRETNQVLLTVIPQNEFLSGTSTELGVVPGFERFSLPGAGIGGQDVQIDLPRISNTTLVTKLMIESGRTVVLGGLVSERTSYEDKKIPLLGDLPLVDFLFKQRNDTVRKENLIIFLTPTIIPRSDVIQEDLANQVREHEERERQSYEELKRRRAAEELRRADEHRMQAEAETFDRIRQGVK